MSIVYVNNFSQKRMNVENVNFFLIIEKRVKHLGLIEKSLKLIESKID